MASVSELETAIAQIDKALHTGTRRVRLADGQETEYQSASAMRAIRADMVRELAALQNTSGRHTRSLIAFGALR